MTLFKVLSPAGAACNGGSGSYPLPKGARPGAWTTLIGSPECCQQGYHLTVRPLMWAASSKARRLFVAEGRGEVHARRDKAAFAQVRLLFEVTPEWALLPLYPDARVFLMMSWRAANGPDAQWPAWANLRGADLRSANLGSANLRGADLGGANLGGADLGSANLRGADLGGANLRGADLRGADLRGANLRGADLRGADLRGADLRGADLGGANLGGANLRSANLGSADLGGANLRGADLRGADLGGANLRGANLRGADLGGAKRPSWLPDTYDVDKHGAVVMRDKAATS